jgi:hypothetical protein
LPQARSLALPVLPSPVAGEELLLVVVVVVVVVP